MKPVQTPAKVLVVGQALLDVILPESRCDPWLRLGGVVHSARALWAIGCEFGVAFTAPDYLVNDIVGYAEALGSKSSQLIGAVARAPNVVLVRNATEHGPQGYEFLLRDQLSCSLDPTAVGTALDADAWTDVLLIPGGFELGGILDALSERRCRVHIDANFEPRDWAVLGRLRRPLDTLMLSTSSARFKDALGGNVSRLVEAARATSTTRLLFKENRGGSRLFDLRKDTVTQAPAHLGPIVHSVGVGDCFDAVFVALRNALGDDAALGYSSWVAAEYGATVDPDGFRARALAWLRVPPNEVLSMEGAKLPWEDRQQVQVYIAAPDFDFVDRTPVDRLAESLAYHNFRPRLPVREFGQVEPNADEQRRRELCESDLALLQQCSMLVAVLLYDDPGTLIELGIAVAKGMPTIVYDPYRRAENLMLTGCPDLVSPHLDEVIDAVFDAAQRVARR
jgi:nucleoside 2-deoxyribosyltransferase